MTSGFDHYPQYWTIEKAQRHDLILPLGSLDLQTLCLAAACAVVTPTVGVPVVMTASDTARATNIASVRAIMRDMIIS